MHVRNTGSVPLGHTGSVAARVEIEAAARALLDALDRQHGRVHMSLNVLEARGALRELLPRVTTPPDPNDRAE